MRAARGSSFMFDFDAGKLLILGVVALVVIGPKELPGVMRQVGQAVAKLRRMAAEFQSQFMEAMREAELDDLKRELASVQEAAKIDVDFNPVEDVKREMTAAITPAAENPATPSELAAHSEPPALPQPAPEAPHGSAATGSNAVAPNANLAPAAAPHQTSQSTKAQATPGQGASREAPAAAVLPNPAASSPSAPGPIVSTPTAASAASPSVPENAVDEAVLGPSGARPAPGDKPAKPPRKRAIESARKAQPGRQTEGDAASVAASKRKRSAKKPLAESDHSGSAAPETAQTRQRRKSAP
jgi:sec-independent protein translocase protein TatB